MIDPTAWRTPRPIDPAVRRAFLDERRRSHERRLDAIHAPTYDANWGEIFPSHRDALDRLLALTRPRGTVLDAACGTGKYWPIVLGSGRTVVGVDQSGGMLAEAHAKHPSVPVGKVGIQEMAFDGVFDAVICVDAIENVGPEDWPVVLERLRAAARPGAPLYITVELIDETEARDAYEAAVARDLPVVPGEHVMDVGGGEIGYHFYPDDDSIRRWLADAGLELLDSRDGDEYRHLLLRRRE